MQSTLVKSTAACREGMVGPGQLVVPDVVSSLSHLLFAGVCSSFTLLKTSVYI